MLVTESRPSRYLGLQSLQSGDGGGLVAEEIDEGSVRSGSIVSCFESLKESKVHSLLLWRMMRVPPLWTVGGQRGEMNCVFARSIDLGGQDLVCGD